MITAIDLLRLLFFGAPKTKPAKGGRLLLQLSDHSRSIVRIVAPIGRQASCRSDRSIDVKTLWPGRKLEADRGAPHVVRTERGIRCVFGMPVERRDEGMRQGAMPQHVTF